MHIWKRALARVGGNFGIAFLSILVTWNFVVELPTEKLITGALLSASVMAGISLFYEIRKYGETVQ
jgi:hypothetical protein